MKKLLIGIIILALGITAFGLDAKYDSFYTIWGDSLTKYGAFNTADINDSAITSVKIADANVLTADIADANVTSAKLVETLVQYVTVDVNAAEIAALNASPKQLVAAQGTGKVIEFVSGAIYYDYVTAAFDTNGDANIKTTTTIVSDTIPGANLLEATADKYRIVQALSADVQGDPNEPLLLSVDTGDPNNPGTAAGTLKVKIAYRIHDFN